MSQHALMVVADEPGTFHWVALRVDGHQIENSSASEGEFDTYAAALDAGMSALAAADGQNAAPTCPAGTGGSIQMEAAP